MYRAATRATTSDQRLRSQAAPPPQGRQRLRWYGPGLVWMLSSVGSGSVLFTPRIGSRYGYALAWLALLTAVLMWVMIREVGRYTVATGRTILDGYRDLPGPRDWALWLIFVPQLVAAVVTIAGIAALAGSALMIELPGGQAVYAIGLIVLSCLLVVSGRYSGMEKVTAALSAVLVLAIVATAVRVLPSPGTMAGGLVPQLPSDFDLYFVLPWIGFILAGAAGIMWYSYWVASRGYGGAVTGDGPDARNRSEKRVDPAERERRVHRWLGVMGRAAALGVVGGALIILSFLVLGAELLRPQGIVPEGIDVARDLTGLLGDVWGDWGRWLLLVGIVIALWGTVLANQDGWGRTFADATIMITRLDKDQPAAAGRLLAQVGRRLRLNLTDRETLKNAYAVVVVTALLILVFLLVRQPVDILSVAGVVAAVHTPVLVVLTLLLNRRHLPPELRPNAFTTTAAGFAAVWYGAFAAVYLLNLAGVQLA
ncbi:Nramp family divalent metal transporter [Verrucosispora sp. WMMA2044]|uniref:Nramp family divalent metal transporter n=1 Tax=Verrucosispora sp. WMMA2044 TaxID=3016419 RepID=UPI00248C02B5|nr:Nramp family divalent metal transporter [Verrucosispora sp. WMMA2044]WBB50272.1 Nramp family divalent metal transporter [Verrucosispora sp. WMMA2044]